MVYSSPVAGKAYPQWVHFPSSPFVQVSSEVLITALHFLQVTVTVWLPFPLGAYAVSVSEWSQITGETVTVIFTFSVVGWEPSAISISSTLPTNSAVCSELTFSFAVKVIFAYSPAATVPFPKSSAWVISI